MPVNPNPVYADLNDEEIAAEQPLTESKMTRLRDNSRAAFRGDVSVPAVELCTLENQRTDSITTTDVFQPDGANGIALGPVVLGAAVVGQSQLKTATGIVSGQTFDGTLPGGEYGFYPQIRAGTSSGTPVSAYIWDQVNASTLGTSYRTVISLIGSVAPAITMFAQQRYITASPPYNIGDGEIPLFVFLLYRSGKIISTYVAQDPPWAYNGPTDIRGFDKRVLIDDGKGGRLKSKVIRMRKVVEKQFTLNHVKTKQITMKEYVNQEVIEEWIPVDDTDQSFKNSDMDLIPHPFMGMEEGDTVVILEPTATEKLLQVHNSSDDISELIEEGYLEIDNKVSNSKTPFGVSSHKFKWKDTK